MIHGVGSTPQTVTTEHQTVNQDAITDQPTVGQLGPMKVCGVQESTLIGGAGLGITGACTAAAGGPLIYANPTIGGIVSGTMCFVGLAITTLGASMWGTSRTTHQQTEPVLIAHRDMLTSVAIIP
jgi:hypothetical protein